MQLKCFVDLLASVLAGSALHVLLLLLELWTHVPWPH